MLHVKFALIAAGSVAVFLAGACPLLAQQLHGFVTPGIHSDLNNEHFAGVGAGLLFDWLDSRISVGAKADLFISGGYFAGRGGPIGQFNFIRSRGLRPFAIGGIAWERTTAQCSVEVWNFGRRVHSAFVRPLRTTSTGSGGWIAPVSGIRPPSATPGLTVDDRTPRTNCRCTLVWPGDKPSRMGCDPVPGLTIRALLKEALNEIFERSLDVGGERRGGRFPQNPWRRAIGSDERGTASASGHMSLERSVHVCGQHTFQVVHQQFNAREAGDLFHDFTPARSLRYPRSINRARCTRCRTAAGSISSARATSAVDNSSRSLSTNASR